MFMHLYTALLNNNLFYMQNVSGEKKYICCNTDNGFICVNGLVEVTKKDRTDPRELSLKHHELKVLSHDADGEALGQVTTNQPHSYSGGRI